MITRRLGLGPHSHVLEIASNDVYLLKNFVAAGIPCLGIEPTSGTADAAQALAKKNVLAIVSSDYRAQDIYAALQGAAPKAELIADPLFEEAPLASPRIPLLRMNVPKWAVMARIL